MMRVASLACVVLMTAPLLMGCGSKSGNGSAGDGAKTKTGSFQSLVRFMPLSNGKSEAQSKDAVLKVDAKALVKEYSADKNVADRKYKGKLLEVTGKVQQLTGVGLRLNGGGNEFQEGVICRFQGSDKPGSPDIGRQLENQGVKKGTDVKIRGVCEGPIDGKRNVFLKNCQLQK